MKHTARFMIIICLFPFAVKAQGAHVEFMLTSGSVISGELVDVGDSTLTVSARAPNPGSAEPAPVLDQTIDLKSIARYTVRGRSDIGTSVLTCMGVGAAAGLLIGLASGNDDPHTFMSFTAGQKAGVLALAFGTVGALIGVVTGAASSRPTAVVTPLPGDRFDALRPYTRTARRAARL